MLSRITERQLPNDARDLTAYDPLGRVQARVLQQDLSRNHKDNGWATEDQHLCFR